MDQIAQNDQAGGLPSGAERFQSLRVSRSSSLGSGTATRNTALPRCKSATNSSRPANLQGFLAEQQELLGAPAPVAGLTWAATDPCFGSAQRDRWRAGQSTRRVTLQRDFILRDFFGPLGIHPSGEGLHGLSKRWQPMSLRRLLDRR